MKDKELRKLIGSRVKQDPRLATGGWLDLTRQAFHLLDYSPLSGRTIPSCMSLLYHHEKYKQFVKLHFYELFVFLVSFANWNFYLCCHVIT